MPFTRFRRPTVFSPDCFLVWRSWRGFFSGARRVLSGGEWAASASSRRMSSEWSVEWLGSQFWFSNERRQAVRFP